MSVANEGEVFGKAGKRSGGSTTPAIDDLLAASKQILSQAQSAQTSGSGPSGAQGRAIELGANQISEALTSGGIGARLPLAQRAVEATRSATSNALRGTDARLARTNLAGTPFGESIRSGVALEGAVKAADAPIQVTMQALEQLLPLLGYRDPSQLNFLEQLRIGLSGMGQAAGAQAGVLGADTSALAQQKNNFWDNTASGMQMGAGYGRA